MVTQLYVKIEWQTHHKTGGVIPELNSSSSLLWNVIKYQISNSVILDLLRKVLKFWNSSY